MKRFLCVISLMALPVTLAGCNAGRSAVGGVEQVGAGLGAAVSAPLEDFNLRQEPIPMVLLQAQANPYDLRNLNQCATIAPRWLGWMRPWGRTPTSRRARTAPI